MKELNDFLLNMFIGEDNLRPVMQFPNLKDGIVCASDGHVLMTAPENELSLKYGTNERYPNAKKTIDEFEKGNLTSLKVRVSDIAKELVKARIIIDKSSIKCEECEGSGVVEWEYRSKDGRYYEKDFECPECEGEGSREITSRFARVRLEMIEDKETGNRHGITIGDLYFHPFQLYRLFMVALVKGCEDIEIFFDKDEYGTTVTYFGDIKVMIMLLRKS